jgi:hypothetical protein
MTLEEQFEQLTVQDVEDFITTKQEEHLQLDFKTVKHASLNSTDDKKNFAEALSGFANSSGGLIVWGIDARKNVDGIDCADSKKEINLPQLLSRLNALTGEAINPLVDGVKHRAIPTDGDKGFAVTIVPESDTTPHMAKCGNNRYFKRSGDSFYQMEHFDLEDMFGRRRKPKLEVNTVVVDRTFTDSSHSIYNYWVLVRLGNTGRWLAKAPYLFLNTEKAEQPNEVFFHGIQSPQLYGLSALPLDFSNLQNKSIVQIQFGANSEVVIHPSTFRDIVRLGVVVPKNAAPFNVNINYQMGAEGIQSTSGLLTIEASEFLDYST